MKFIDLFAGLGGFHKALHELGHECVFASEINQLLCDVYEINWGIRPVGDIKKVIKNDITSIPKHDILCAGFPCQPFSKAGKQQGMNDKERGNLFDEIVKVLEFRRPNYFILENVPFIAKHDNEETWKYMSLKLESLGYTVDHRNYSPHELGIPQHRLRIFIVGSLNGLDHFDFDLIDKQKSKLGNINDFINDNPIQFRKLPKENKRVIKLWQDFISSLPDNVNIPGFPIWGMEFGATYPFNNIYPYLLSSKELGGFKGNFGISLKGMDKSKQFINLPSYARVDKEFPSWKKRWIGYNRQFYIDNKEYIKNVVNEIAQLPNQSWQKLEWNVGNSKRSIKEYILQFRASGLRVKSPDIFPSLVCTNTQVPIIGWRGRYITKDEGVKLQSLEGLKRLPEPDNAAFKALGNAVNSKIVRLIAENLLLDNPKHKINGQPILKQLQLSMQFQGNE
ncbi:MAG: DNA (cytosine-5-)-methyltransferase [Bacteroidales bacterium]|jgi:DNA (cytosine-5)-methyltransferase 1|nr:DNA (cytosine-5-)-methyltransferase [Bacteroidales bacterium]